MSVAARQRDSLLLRQNHVHRLHQPSLRVQHVVLRDWVDEVAHVGEREVHRTEARQDRHDCYADDTDSRHALFDGEDSAIHAKQWERIPDSPEAVEVAEPEEHRQRRRPSNRR